MGQRDLIIAGAGIGGLTAALALAEQGFRCTICERADRLSEIGAGIQLTPNAGRLLDRLGIGKAIATAAAEPVSIDIRSGQSGGLLSSISMNAVRKRYGFPSRVIARAELQAVLAAAAMTHPAIELRLGVPVVDFTNHEDEILVRMESEMADTQPAAALIAADGVSSHLREKISGVAKATPIGRTAWRATIPVHGAPASLPTDRIGLWLGPEAHLIHYPISGGQTVNIVAIVAETWPGAGWSEPGDHNQLVRHFASWTPAVRAIIDASTEWRKWAILSVDPAAPWVSGRAALLGDAAHAMPPFMAQGAAMAIEDAAVLAGALGASPDDIPAGLETYERERKERVSRVHAAAFRTGAHYHRSGLVAVLRNAMLRVAGRHTLLGMNDWIYGWDNRR